MSLRRVASSALASYARDVRLMSSAHTWPPLLQDTTRRMQPGLILKVLLQAQPAALLLLLLASTHCGASTVGCGGLPRRRALAGDSSNKAGTDVRRSVESSNPTSPRHDLIASHSWCLLSHAQQSFIRFLDSGLPACRCTNETLRNKARC